MGGGNNIFSADMLSKILGLNIQTIKFKNV